MKLINSSIAIDMSWSEFIANPTNVPIILIDFPNTRVATKQRSLKNLHCSSTPSVPLTLLYYLVINR